MSNVKILDCTLRDGGHVNSWDFSPSQISSAITHLTNAGLDYIEIGYLTSILGSVNGTQFQNVETASRFLPKDRKRSKFLAMTDVALFDTDTLCPRSEDTLDGIRVVFYKRQVEQAIDFCGKIAEKGYDLFIQPMVTIDYSIREFDELIGRFCDTYSPYAVSVVDSFGCMLPNEIQPFIDVLDARLHNDVKIGFHAHDNLQFSKTNALSIYERAKSREYVLDASVSGMGRGAGNLKTEILAYYANIAQNGNYDIEQITHVLSEVTEPVSRTAQWGYSPYFMLTAFRRAHPNFATFLLESHDVSVTEFKEYLNAIPDEMLTRCTRPYVEELYAQLKEKREA